ncbi:MAG: TonB-dependent receptor [Bacteroidia bacterium]|nr:TonB-dependent receptor [Bacteroidia bacterium]
MKRGNRLTLVFVFLFVCQFLAAQTSVRLYERFYNKPLSQVLNNLGKSYDYIFAYDAEKVKNIYVSVELKGVYMEEALDLLLQNTDLEYAFLKSRQVIIKPRRKEYPFQNTRSVSSPNEYLTGYVRDSETGVPLVFARVYTDSENGTYTDSLGYFRLILRSSQDSVQIRYLGYKKLKLSVKEAMLYNPGEYLLKSEILRLDEVLISEGSPQTLVVADGVSEISLNPSQITTLSSLGEPDIFRTIQLLPGISSNQESASDLNIRGGSSDQNLIMFDGITIYQPSHFFGTFSAFNAHATKDVQVFRGGFSAKYGGRTSAVLDITGKPGNPQDLVVGAGINLMNAHTYLETPLFKRRGALMIAGRRSFSDIVQSPMYRTLFNNIFQHGAIYNDIKESREEGKNLSLDPSFYFDDLNVKFTFRPSDKDVFAVSGYQGRDMLAYSAKDYTDSAFSIHTEDSLLLKNQGLSFNWSRQWNAHFYSKTTTAFSRFNQRHIYNYLYSEANDPGVLHRFPQDNRLSQFSFRNDNEWEVNDKSTISFGADISFLDIRYHFQWFQQDTRLLEDLIEKSGKIYAGYAEHIWTPVDKLSLSTGIRYNYYEVTGKNYWEPRTSLRYNVSDKLKFKAAWSVHNQFMSSILQFSGLSVGEDFWALADGDTIPVVHASHFIVGGAWETKGFLVDIELYYKKTTGLVTYEYSLSPGSLEINQVNLVGDGVAFARGIDVMVQKKWGNFSGWVSYSLGRVTHRFPGIESGKPFPAAYDHLHKFNTVNTYTHNRWEVSLNWIWSSGRPYTDLVERHVSRQPNEELIVDLGSRNAKRLPAYHRMDINSTYLLTPESKNAEVKVGISVFNLYNRKNVRDFRYSVVTDAKRKQPELISMNRNLLGITPNIFLSVTF